MGLITDIDTANTGIMARLGKVFGIIDRLETFQSDIVDSTTKSFRKGINEYISALNDATNTKLELADSLISNHDDLRNSVGMPVLSRCLSTATKTLIEMVNDETPLESKTVRAAMFELRRLMATAGTPETLDATTISIGSTAAASGNVGTGTVVVSAEADNKFHSTMASYPTCRTETLRFKCVKDATSKGIVSGGEIFSINGKQPFSRMDHRWPGGSGYVGNYAATSESLNDGQSVGRNILRNSGFENFDSGVKNPGWDIGAGSAGVNILPNTSTPAHGNNSLQLRSDGSTNLFIRQKIGTKQAGGTLGTVDVDGLYVISFLIKQTNTSSSAGALTVGLMQQDGTAVSDSTTTIAHGDISGSYTQKTFSFRAGGTGLVLPSPLYFGIRQSTAFTSGTYLTIDRLVFTRMIPTAPGGVHCAILPGATDFVVDDEFTVAVTNNGEGLFEKYLDKCFDTYNMGIFLPNATSSERIDDALVT